MTMALPYGCFYVSLGMLTGNRAASPSQRVSLNQLEQEFSPLSQSVHTLEHTIQLAIEGF
jgi:hypothetical protein